MNSPLHVSPSYHLHYISFLFSRLAEVSDSKPSVTSRLFIVHVSSAPAFLYSGGIHGLAAVISPRHQGRDVFYPVVNVESSGGNRSGTGSSSGMSIGDRSGGTIGMDEIGGLDDRPSRPDPDHPNVRSYCEYLVKQHQEIAASAGVKIADVVYR